MALFNAADLPNMSSDDIQLELMLLAEKPKLEPWEKTQRARMAVELASRDPTVQAKVRQAKGRRAAKSRAEIEASARELLASMGNNPELEALMRKGGLIS